jgi:3-hydroxymyristoyl/3-hydroxydecanoyl-(acyl carrier protein) dehydratase
MNLDNIQIQPVETGPHSFTVALCFDASCEYFMGHFDDFSLVPGFVQLQLAMELSKKVMNEKLKFSEIKNMKFFSPILPDVWVTLKCWLGDDGMSLNFKYFNDKKQFSKGLITFK